MSLTLGLHRALQQQPHKTATVYRERRLSYAELGARVARLAGGLLELGLAPGDRVALLAQNSDRTIEYVLATWWAGGAVNPVNIRWSVPEIAYSLEDSETGILIVDEHFLAAVAAIRERAPALRVLIYAGEGPAPAGMLAWEALANESAPMEDARRAGTDLAGLFYTGGTTGSPKGVMLSHTNLWSSAIARMADLPIPPDTVSLLAVPLFHLAGLGRVLTQLIVGGTSVVLPGFNAVAVLESIARERVTDLLLVPTMLQMLLDHPDFARYRLDSLKRISYGAAPISEALLARALQAFPGIEFTHGYGMTEASPVISVNPPGNHTPEAARSGLLRSAGRAGYGVEIKIVGPDGEELPRHTVGEVLLRGPNVMLGYWNKPEETRAALRGGWLHTGDGAYMDEAGYIFIVDRLKDMIVSGGENVYSAEVENVVGRHPAVAACAVIGIPSETWGEAVHAVVVLRDSAAAISAEDLRAHCRQSLAPYKCPKSVEFRDALPLSGAGKVLKTALREPYWKHQARGVN